MKLIHLKWSGIGRFSDTVEIPVADLGDAAVVAIVGENGAGKTTAVEMLPGLLYRSTPSRGPVAALANARGSFIEAVVETDERYTLRLMIDGVARGKPSEGYLMSSAGALASGKLRDYDSAIAKRFPSREVFLSSVFAAQSGEGRFLDLPATERKQLFAKLLGLGRLEVLCQEAGQRVSASESMLEQMGARVAELRVTGATADKLRAELEAAQAAHRTAVAERERVESEASATRAALDAWVTRAADLRRDVDLAQADVDQARTRLAAAGKAAEAEHARLGAIALKLGAIEERLSQRDALVVDSLGMAEIEAQLSAAEASVAAAREEEAAHLRAMSAWHDRRTAADRRLHELRTASIQERKALVTQIAGQKAEVERLGEAASGVTSVPCHGEGDFAGCRLIAAAAKGKAALPRAREVLAELDRRLESLTVESPELAAARVAAEDVELAPVAPVVRPMPDVAALRAQLQRVNDARARLAALDAFAAQAEQLEREAAEVRKQAAAAAADHDASFKPVIAAQNRLGAASRAEEAHAATRPTPADVGRVDRARSEETRLVVVVARTEQSVAAAEEAAARVAEVEREMAAVRADSDDWHQLQTALGRNGIQALEIDASGPEVSELTNKLLHACYGSRFSVSLETTALKADGKSTKEVFDLRVIDTERGVDGSADQLSGGEKVLVSEALSLAIAVFNTRRSSMPLLTLFRDECAGALSSANAGRYVEMLRRAREVGGFHRVYFIAHQPQLWDLADKCILFEDGACRIVDEVSEVAPAAGAEAA